MAQTVDMTEKLVDPDRELGAEGVGHRGLPERAPGHRHVGGPFRQVGHGGQDLADLTQEDRVGLAQHQKIAGLGDVLRRGAPMHPAAVRLADDAAELPHQRDQRVAGAGEALVDPRAVHQLEPGLRGDGFGRGARNDAPLAAMAYCYEQGWTAGLPVVRPVADRVEAMLVGDSRPAETVIATHPATGLELSLHAAAVNAVMAGCLPEYFPVLVAAFEAMDRPDFNFHGSTASTGGSAPLLVVSGAY